MQILVDEESICNRIVSLAKEIDDYYDIIDPNNNNEIVVVGLLSGGIVFMTDLIRKMSHRLKIDFMRTSTYPNGDSTQYSTQIITRPHTKLYNAHVLVVDDILDTGSTLEHAKEHLKMYYPSSLRTAVLVRKQRERKVDADFIGFDIEDKWVIGYGLDYKGEFRNLPYIAVYDGEKRC